MILGHSDLIKYIEEQRLRISPFQRENIVCNGIDLRLGPELQRLKTTQKTFDTRKKNDFSLYYEKEKGTDFVIGPHEKVLLCTLEELTLPEDIIGIVGLRSTYSRLGLNMPLGFIESGFRGQLTLEVTGGSFPLKVYSNDRIFHVVFIIVSSSSKTIYKGKYQNQKGVTLPILP